MQRESRDRDTHVRRNPGGGEQPPPTSSPPLPPTLQRRDPCAWQTLGAQ